MLKFFFLNFLDGPREVLPTVLKETGGVGGISGEKKSVKFPEMAPTICEKRGGYIKKWVIGRDVL